MRAAGLVVVVVVVVFAACTKTETPTPTPPPPTTRQTLTDVGPRTVSTQTAYPLLVWGEGLDDKSALQLGAPFSRKLPLHVVGEGVAAVRLPADLRLKDDVAEAAVDVTVVDEAGVTAAGAAVVVFVNDAGFPDVHGLVVDDDGRAFTVSTTTDTLFALDTKTGAVTQKPTLDGPTALARAGSGELVVGHRFSDQLLLVTPDLQSTRTVTASKMVADLAVSGDTVFVAEQMRDRVLAVDVKSGAQRWATAVHPNPNALVVDGARVWAGSAQTGELEALSTSTGAHERGPLGPRAGVAIVGRTSKYAAQVMGGKAVRALATSKGALLVASIGPNVGPNADHEEVTHNGGIGVVTDKGFVRHVGESFGVPQDLVVDDKRGVVYVADVSTGVVRVVDAKGLATATSTKTLATLAMAPPASFPLFRKAEDFGVNGRVGVEVHSGPSALALSKDGNTLYVLLRFTGEIAAVDVKDPKKPQRTQTWPIVDVLQQRERRLGQILYFADVGRTGMSCDSCHLEGHTEGIFFSKSKPMRIYRSTSIRGARDTPPYFNPPSLATVHDMASFVGSRNRYQNPPLDDAEVSALTLFTSGWAVLPNPFLDDNGLPPASLTLSEGGAGDPRRGLKVFQNRCVNCHPPAVFSTDQNEKTRIRFMDVDTPVALPLRLDQQDVSFTKTTPPSLAGVFDTFPLLTSGLAGLAVDGDNVVVDDRDALRDLLLHFGGNRHGNTAGLGEQARNDLESWLMCL